MRFGSTGQIPFNASRQLHLCQRAEQAVRYSDARSSAMTSSEAVDDFATTSLGAEGAATMLERLRQSDGLCTDG